MKGNINLISYDCYQQATEKQLAGLKWKENRVYYISEIRNEKIQDEIYGYIDDRCRRLSLSTAVNDIYRFDLLKEFLKVQPRHDASPMSPEKRAAYIQRAQHSAE